MNIQINDFYLRDVKEGEYEGKPYANITGIVNGGDIKFKLAAGLDLEPLKKFQGKSCKLIGVVKPTTFQGKLALHLLTFQIAAAAAA